METCSVLKLELTFESLKENLWLWCYHSTKTSLAALLLATIGFSIFCKIKFGIFLESTFGTPGWKCCTLLPKTHVDLFLMHMIYMMS